MFKNNAPTSSNPPNKLPNKIKCEQPATPVKEPAKDAPQTSPGCSSIVSEKFAAYAYVDRKEIPLIAEISPLINTSEQAHQIVEQNANVPEQTVHANILPEPVKSKSNPLDLKPKNVISEEKYLLPKTKTDSESSSVLDSCLETSKSRKQRIKTFKHSRKSENTIKRENDADDVINNLEKLEKFPQDVQQNSNTKSNHKSPNDYKQDSKSPKG